MIKMLAKFEYVAGSKLYQFFCDNDSPTGEIKNALNKFIQETCQIEDAVAEQQKAAEEQIKQEVTEPPKVGEDGNQQ
jgi:hypothetical protein